MNQTVQINAEGATNPTIVTQQGSERAPVTISTNVYKDKIVRSGDTYIRVVETPSRHFDARR